MIDLIQKIKVFSFFDYSNDRIRRSTRFISVILILLLSIFASEAQSNYKLDSLISIINTTEDNNEILQAYAELIRSKKPQIDEVGKLYLDEALTLSNKTNNKFYLALFTCYESEYFMQQGLYSESFEALQKALSIGEEINSDTILTHAHIDIAIIFYYWKNFSNAEEHILKALDYAKTSALFNYLPSIYNLLGAIYGEQLEPEKAKSYMLEYLKYGQKNNNPRYIISAYNNIALLSQEMNQMDSAMHYSKLSLKIAEQSKNLAGQHLIYNSLTRLYLSVNKYDSAYAFLRKAMGLKDKTNTPTKVLLTYKYAYQYFKNVNETDSALKYHEIYNNLKDSLFNNEKFNKITELQNKLETEKNLIVIKNLEAKNKIKNIQFFGILTILVLILLIFFLFYRSAKLKNNLILHEKALMEEKSSSMKIKLDYQQREMAFNALYIVNQNKIFDGISKKLQEIENLPAESKSQALKSLAIDIRKNKKASEKKSLEIKFKKSHANFYKMMHETYPNLTKKELDLCAYLKLDMSTKEIATLTNQSIRALEVARSRLRKKLGLESSTNLAEFIRDL